MKTKLPDKWDESTPVVCEVCEKQFPAGEQYAYLGGFYCSKECYGTLFEKCDLCGQGNMTVPSNQKRYGEHICDKCYNQKHGLVVVQLGIGPFQKDWGGSG